MNAKAKIFMNGRSQAVRLPAEFRFEGREVEIRRDPLTGDVVLSEVKKTDMKGSWEEFFQLRDQLKLPDDFMKDREQGRSQRDDLFDEL